MKRLIYTAFILFIAANSFAQTKTENIINNILGDEEGSVTEESGDAQTADEKKKDDTEVTRPAPTGEDKTLLETGIQLISAGNYDAGIEKLKKLAEKFPQSPYNDQGALWRGRACIKKNEYSAAIEELAKIKQESGEYPMSIYTTADIYLNQKKYALSLEYYTKVSSMFPEHELADDALLKSANIHLKERDGNSALTLALNVIKFYPERESVDDAFYLIGKIYEKDQKLKDIEKARAFYKKFIYKAETLKEKSFATSPLLERVKSDLKFLEKMMNGR